MEIYVKKVITQCKKDIKMQIQVTKSNKVRKKDKIENLSKKS